MKHDINKIRAAICKRHGGFETASDREILALWRTLCPDRQAEYLAGEQGAGSEEPKLPTPAAEYEVSPAAMREAKLYGLDLTEPEILAAVAQHDGTRSKKNNKITRDEFRAFAEAKGLSLIGEKENQE